MVLYEGSFFMLSSIVSKSSLCSWLAISGMLGESSTNTARACKRAQLRSTKMNREGRRERRSASARRGPRSSTGQADTHAV